MNDNAFDAALDALARGEHPDTSDGLTRFAADLYRKEHDVTMPVAAKRQIAQNLGLMMAAPVSNRTRRAHAMAPARNRSRWLTAITVALAALLALTGVLQWGVRPDTGDNRFGMLSPAVPTAEATPAATPAGDIGWLTPITPGDCPDDVALTTVIPTAVENPYVGLPDRAYGPYTLPADYTRGDVFQRAREVRACAQSGSFGPYMSTRLVYEMYDREFVTSGEAERHWADQIVQGKELSAFYASEFSVSLDTLGLIVPADTPGYAGYTPGYHPVINSDWIVQLADGRVVVLVSSLSLVSAGTPVVPPGPIPAGAPAEMPEPTAGFMAWVFVRQEGDWMLDEFLPVCFGDCGAFWDSRPGANLLVTPAPTPTMANDTEIVPVGGDRQVKSTPTPHPSATGTAPPEIEPIDVTPTPTG